MTTLLIFTTVLFLAYIAIITCEFGWLPSISDSFYKLQERKKGAGYWFTGWCFAVGMLTGFLMIEVSMGEWFHQFMGFISGGTLCLVGAAPHFKSTARVIHSVAALLCGIPAILFCFLSGSWPVVFISFVICFLLYRVLKKRNPVFWAEVMAFTATYLVLFLHLNGI